jgi:hypothetical protein
VFVGMTLWRGVPRAQGERRGRNATATRRS